MSTEPHHIIHKLIVEVETNSKEKGHTLKDNAAGFVSGSLSPVLEELFEELEKKLNGKVLTLDNLTVNVSAATTDLTHGDIERLISSAIRKEIQEQIPPVNESVVKNNSKSNRKEAFHSNQNQQESEHLISVTKRQLQSVFHFLKTGSRPWWITNNRSLNELMETPNLIEMARTDTETLVRELLSSTNETVVKRMLLQLPESVLIEWFIRAFHFPQELPKTIKKVPSIIQNGEIKKKWWTVLLSAFQEQHQKGRISVEKQEQLVRLAIREQEAGIESITELIQSITGQQIAPDRKKIQEIIKEEKRGKKALEIEKKPEKERKSDETAAIDLYAPVENAGLILLHPFLRPFFTEIGLMEGDEITDPELAVHVLHFLATGNENAWEYELQFEKFLCDIPLDEPIQQALPLSKEIKEEAENLLSAVLEHWTALRSDSADLLRHEFLQREAKIIIEEFQSTRLVFERKAQDILLEKLPWNLGIVKVDWRKDLLFVEW